LINEPWTAITNREGQPLAHRDGLGIAGRADRTAIAAIHANSVT
jgi:hypothetical protein